MINSHYSYSNCDSTDIVEPFGAFGSYGSSGSLVLVENL